MPMESNQNLLQQFNEIASNQYLLSEFDRPRKRELLEADKKISHLKVNDLINLEAQIQLKLNKTPEDENLLYVIRARILASNTQRLETLLNQNRPRTTIVLTYQNQPQGEGKKTRRKKPKRPKSKKPKKPKTPKSKIRGRPRK
tara:strand:- start:460 stop:888 length:429 start_codon:yes stop_codon:yes gene_type:complete